jgi:hypothetical protein
MCDVPNMAVILCRIYWMLSWYCFQIFLNLYLQFPCLQWLPVWQRIFMFHIFWISVLWLLYFNSFSASFCITFLSNGIATFINKKILPFLFLIIIMSGLFARTPLSACTPWFHNAVIPSCSVTDLGMWEYQFSVKMTSKTWHFRDYNLSPSSGKTQLLCWAQSIELIPISEQQIWSGQRVYSREDNTYTWETSGWNQSQNYTK